MENSTRFDLNEAVRHWRDNLACSPAFRSENLDELEAHLRDSVAALQANGLNPQEAFLAASRRLGRRQELEPEFAKVNSANIWIERSLWMVGGILAFYLIYEFWRVVTPSLSYFVAGLSVNVHWIGFLLVALNWALLALGISVVYWLVKQRFTFGTHVAEFCLRSPILAGIAIMLVFYSFPYLREWVGTRTAPVSIPGIEQMAPTLNAWMFLGYWAEVIAWMGGLVFLAWHLEQRRQQGASIGPMRTYGGRESPTPHSAQGLPDQSCAEHCLWMVAGVVLYHFILDMRLLFEDRLANLAFSWPTVGPVLGFLLIPFGWAVVGLFIALLWRCATRWERGCAHVQRFCLRHPILTAIGLVILFSCFQVILRLFAKFVPTGADAGERPPDWFRWTLWKSEFMVFLQYLVPVVLFLWLARRRWKLETIR